MAEASKPTGPVEPEIFVSTATIYKPGSGHPFKPGSKVPLHPDHAKDFRDAKLEAKPELEKKAEATPVAADAVLAQTNLSPADADKGKKG